VQGREWWKEEMRDRTYEREIRGEAWSDVTRRARVAMVGVGRCIFVLIDEWGTAKV
jgi:hypothetical protein